MLVAVLVPGSGYTTQGPLFDLAEIAVTALKGRVVHLEWTFPAGLMDVGAEPFVRAHVMAALHRLGDEVSGERIVLVGKSVGSHAATLAAERSLPALWLTPLLRDRQVVDAITSSTAPALLVGGTADRHWDAAIAEATGKQVLSVPDADHNLHVPGSVRRNVEVLAQVGEAVDAFLTAANP